MEVSELKAMIKSKTIPSFMIFTGDEWLIQKIYISQISKTTNLEIRYADTVSDILDKMSTQSLFNKNYLYVIRDDKEFITTEKLYANITARLGSNMLILVLNNADKRLKMLKMYNNSTFEFKPLNQAVLKQYIQKEIELSDRNCNILMEICEYNYGRCLLEVDKIKQYVDYLGEAKVQDGVFDKFLKEGVIYIPPRDNIFTFIKAVLQNKMNLAFELWEELKELKTPTMSILYNLYNQTKQVLQVQTCTNKDVVKTTGLSTWQVHNARECANVFSNEDLLYIMHLVQKVESGIKRGLIDEAIAIDYILIHI